MKHKSWFIRLLLSYLPIFLIVTAVLIVVFFLSIGDLFRKQAEKSSDVFSHNVIQTVDNALQSIDFMIRHEMNTSTAMERFFNGQLGLNQNFEIFQFADHIRQIKQISPMIDSIYLFRREDNLVLGDPTMNLEDFGDKEFVVKYINENIPYAWTDVRQFRALRSQEKSTPVISMVRKYPMLSGSKGLLVVNVRIQDLARSVESLLKDETSYLDFRDSHNGILFSSVGQEQADERLDKAMSRVTSDYTGWELRTGLKDDSFFSALSTLSYVWFGIVFLTIMIGAGWLYFVSRQHSKPIEHLSTRIQGLFAQKSVAGLKGEDEIRIIESVIDNLVEQSGLHAKQRQEDLVYRKRMLFRDLIEGNRQMNGDAWAEEAELLGLPKQAAHFQVALFEIDRYPEFSATYSRGDQLLLKYVLSSVVAESAAGSEIWIWSEWLAEDQLTVILMSPDGPAQKLIPDLLSQVREWIGTNVSYTVTVGLGASVMVPSEIYQSHDEALDALSYKSALGNNRIIGYWDVQVRPQGEKFQLLQQVRQLSSSFRTGDSKWEKELAAFFDSLRSDFMSREETADYLRFLQYNLYREVLEFSSELEDHWQRATQPQMEEASDRLESLIELETAYRAILLTLADEVASIRDRRGNTAVIGKIKTYIDEQYKDPGLSLQQVADHFKYNMNYMSTLFKEEFGEKFVDYLMKVRMREAMRLLRETDETVQDIAMKVGYNHSVSFIRVFKKEIGKTPGDYRKDS